MEIKIKYLEDIEPLEQHGDMVDLRAAVDVMAKAGEFMLIPLGVAMQLPDGYEAHIYPRSSTFKKWGMILTNGVGIVDNGYCGDDDMWYFPAYFTRDVNIPKNTRIAQFRVFENQPQIDFKVVYKLNNENRGGIGSTGE